RLSAAISRVLSYRTFASGGYIITRSPPAIRMGIPPISIHPRNSPHPGVERPTAKPQAKASRNHTPNKLSRNDIRPGCEVSAFTAVSCWDSVINQAHFLISTLINMESTFHIDGRQYILGA